MQSSKKLTGMKNKNTRLYDDKPNKKQRNYQTDRRIKYTKQRKRDKEEIVMDKNLTGEYIPASEVNNRFSDNHGWNARDPYAFPARYAGMYEFIKHREKINYTAFAYPEVVIQAVKDPTFYMEKYLSAFNNRPLTYMENIELTISLMMYRVFVTKELDFNDVVPDPLLVKCCISIINDYKEEAVLDKIYSANIPLKLLLMLGESLTTTVDPLKIRRGYLGTVLTKMVCAKTEEIMPTDKRREGRKSTTTLLQALSPLKIF